ncbi:hypothetical protein BH20VER2_BH20VER2_18180 [soil metagenome]
MVRFVCCLFFLCAFSLPAPGAEQQHLRKEIEQLYARGLAGDAAAVEECIVKLEAILQTQPKNQLARVYLGSALTLRSRDLGFGPSKLKVLKHGVAVMDEAVAAAPEDAKVRLARALTTQALPFFLGRASTSRQDFAALVEMAQRPGSKIAPGDLQIIYYNAALGAKKNGDRARAAELLRKAQQHSADPALARKVEAELATL